MAGPATRPVIDVAAGSAVAGEVPAAVAVDLRGNTYVTGTREGTVYVTKIDPSGQRRLYTASLGGSGAFTVKAIAVDSEGNAYIAGYTSSSGLPVIGGVQRSKAGGTDAFVAKLDAKGGRWLYSTYLGGAGDDAANSIAVDREGNAWVTGWTASSDFPLRQALQSTKVGSTDAFIVKLGPDGAALAFATYAGGGSRTAGNGIALDSSGAVYVAGEIRGRGEPGGLIGGAASGQDGFLLKLAADGAGRVYSSLVGGSGDDAATAIAVDADGAPYITGWTDSSDFPVTTAAARAGGRDVFVAKFGKDGGRVYATLLGGSADEAAQSIALDSLGNAYVAGVTNSADFLPSDDSESGAWRSFLVKLSADGTRRLASQLVAAPAGSGLAVGGSGEALLAGTRSTGRPYLAKVPTCGFRLSEAMKSVGAGGESGTVTIDTTPECAWTAGASAPWLEVMPSGAGRTAVGYRVSPNGGAPRGASLAIGGQTLLILQAGGTSAPRVGGGFTGPIRGNTGFTTTAMNHCDDINNPPLCTEGNPIDLGFSVNFFGQPYTQVYVDNNGNVTFGGINGNFTPAGIPSLQSVMIAPFWADVDTENAGSAVTTYGTDTVNGLPAFGVNWVNVGYYRSHIDKLNSFQLVLISRSDVGAGFFDIEMNYSSIQWETGDASGGSGGLGGQSAHVGFTNGTGTAGTFYELPGSGVNGAFLDNGPNSLINNSVNSGGTPGRYVYGVRSGAFCATGINPASATVPNAGGQITITVTASNQTCGWSVGQMPAWITLVSPTSGTGTGNGSVVLQVAANAVGQRAATVIIAYQDFHVAQNSQVPPDLTIASTHMGLFKPGDTSDAYAISVTNSGSLPTSGDVTVTDQLPSALTAKSIVGTGWSCVLATLTCKRSDSLAAFTSYPPVNLTVSVDTAAIGFVTNVATVAGGSEFNTANDTSYDLTNITGLGFYTVTPCRVADTRPGQGRTGAFGPPAIAGGTFRDIPILNSSCNVPAMAQAYSLNITVVPRTQLSYLSVWPSGQPQPNVSTLNSFDGRVLANAAIVPAGDNGAIRVYVSDTSDVIVDINGFFGPPGQGSLSFYSVTPCRVADTRGNQGKSGQLGPPAIGAGETRTIPVTASSCGAAQSSRAYSLNITAVPPGPLTYLTAWPAGFPQPNVSTLNSLTGEVVANAAIVPVGTGGSINLFASDLTDVIVDINGFFAPPGGQGELLFYGATPCRVADTRSDQGFTGMFGAPTISALTSRYFPVPSSPCGIPNTAKAYSFNMTAVPPGPLIYLTTWPTGLDMPVVSTLNSFLGKVVANAAIVPAGLAGDISVYVSNTTDVIVDVNGYFGPPE